MLAAEDLHEHDGTFHCVRVDELAGTSRVGSALLKAYRWLQQIEPIPVP